MDLSPGSIPGDVPGKTLFATFNKVFEPGIVSTRSNAFTAAEVPDRSIPPESFQHDADLFLGGELAAGNALDVSYELLSFLGPSFSLSDIIYSLGHNPAPFHSLL